MPLICIGVHQRFQLHRGDARKGIRTLHRHPIARLTRSQRSLESFFGIGPKVSQKLMAKFYIHPWAKVGALKNSTVLELTEELTNMKIENDLRRQVQDDIRRLRDMGTYRGRRHAMGLPVRGQRTRTQVWTSTTWSKVEILTTTDQHSPTFEQDGTRRNWKSVDVGLMRVFRCTILYSTQAWNGVCNTNIQKSHDSTATYQELRDTVFTRLCSYVGCQIMSLNRHSTDVCIHGVHISTYDNPAA